VRLTSCAWGAPCLRECFVMAILRGDSGGLTSVPDRLGFFAAKEVDVIS
jgi:hypothetical protein